MIPKRPKRKYCTPEQKAREAATLAAFARAAGVRVRYEVDDHSITDAYCDDPKFVAEAKGRNNKMHFRPTLIIDKIKITGLMWKAKKHGGPGILVIDWTDQKRFVVLDDYNPLEDWRTQTDYQTNPDWEARHEVVMHIPIPVFRPFSEAPTLFLNKKTEQIAFAFGA